MSQLTLKRTRHERKVQYLQSPYSVIFLNLLVDWTIYQRNSIKSVLTVGGIERQADTLYISQYKLPADKPSVYLLLKKIHLKEVHELSGAKSQHDHIITRLPLLYFQQKSLSEVFKLIT